MPGLVDVDDTRPLPGIDWEITVDRATAGRYGADVATVGPMIQLVTRGALIGTFVCPPEGGVPVSGNFRWTVDACECRRR